MRMSRVLLVGAAVAGVAVTTSAFTGSNTMPAAVPIVGYGEVTVTGINVTAVTYNRDATDSSILGSVEFDTDHASSISALTATMTLKQGGTFVINTTCAHSGTAPAQTITCPGGGVLFNDFDTVGLTVGGS